MPLFSIISLGIPDMCYTAWETKLEVLKRFPQANEEMWENGFSAGGIRYSGTETAQTYLWKLAAAMHWILGEGRERVQNCGVTHTSPPQKHALAP